MTSIDTIAELTGIDLTAATADLEQAQNKYTAYRGLRTNLEDVQQAVTELIDADAENIPDAWANVVDTHARHLAWADLEERMFTRISRRETAAEKAAPWKALHILTAHVEKIGREITKLAQHDIDTAERAIKDGHVKEYEKFTALVAELEEIATLPELPKRDADPALVLVNPPLIPEYKNGEEHTEDEQRLHQQARAYRKAKTLPARLLTAARNGWTITPATTNTDYQERARQILNGTTYTDGVARHTVQ